jgi:hypothetical protein
MKNFDFKGMLTTAGAVVVGLFVFSMVNKHIISKYL